METIKKTIFGVIAIGTVFFTTQVSASTIVRGCCSSTGPIASPQEVHLAAQQATQQVNANTTIKSLLVQKTIRDVGAVIGNEIQKSKASNEALVKESTKQVRDLLVEYGAAQSRIEAERTFGPNAVMNNVCTNPEVSGLIQNGMIAEKKVNVKLNKDSKVYNDMFTLIVDLQKHIKDKPAKDITSDAILPKNKTFSNKGVKVAQGMSELITNPLPEMQISDSQKKSLPGAKYEIVQKIKAAKMVIPQAVFNKSIAAHSPSIQAGGQAIKMHKEMGGSGNPDEIGVVNGMISPYAMLDLKVKSRFANPNWYLEINSEKNEIGLLKELAAMDALGLELQRRQLELTQLMALMMAQEISGSVNKEMLPALKIMYDRVK